MSLHPIIADAIAPHLGSIRITHEDRLRSIAKHWRETVQNDPAVKLPAWFSSLLEAAALAIEAEENRYAERMQRADQRDRLEGKVDQLETATDGRTLRPGR